MSLKNWQLNGWLVAHTTSQQEIADLFAVADRDLNDCTASGLSADWRLNITYNAALQLATAALAACGYRAVREAHHFRVIQSLIYTIDLPVRWLLNLTPFGRREISAAMKEPEWYPITKLMKCLHWQKTSVKKLIIGCTNIIRNFLMLIKYLVNIA